VVFAWQTGSILLPSVCGLYQPYDSEPLQADTMLRALSRPIRWPVAELATHACRRIGARQSSGYPSDNRTGHRNL